MQDASQTEVHEGEVVDLTTKEEPPRDVARKILTLMGPTIVGSILSFSTQAITNSFVGRRLGPDLFAHYTLGISVANLFGFSIGIGLNGALDTFISQAYGRDRQATRDIGVSVQRATFLSLSCAIPLAFVFIWGGPIFRLVFGEDLGNGALVFTRHAVPNLVLSFLRDILTKTLQAINLPELVLYSTIVSALSCFTLNYLFTSSIGTAVSVLTATQGIQLAVLLGLARWHPSVTFWHHCEWPSKDAYDFSGLALFLKVGIPSLIAVCAEWWAFEVLDVVAASISVHTVATVNLVLTIGSLYFSMALAISVATSVLVGNALGENRPALARQYARIGIAIDQCMNFINATLFILFRRQIARTFTQDAEMENTFCSMILVIALYICGDSTQFCLQSIFKGVGQQKEAAKVVMLSLWAVGLPMTVVLGRWAGLGGAGVMMGLICGFVVEIPMLWLKFSTWKWDALALEASKRLDDGDGEAELGNDDEGEGETAPSGIIPRQSDTVDVPSAHAVLAKVSEAAATLNLKVQRKGLVSPRADMAEDGHSFLGGNLSEPEELMIRHASSEVANSAACGAAVHMISTPPLTFSISSTASRGRPKTLPSTPQSQEEGFGVASRPITVNSGKKVLLPPVQTVQANTKQTMPTPTTHTALQGSNRPARPLTVLQSSAHLAPHPSTATKATGNMPSTDVFSDIFGDAPINKSSLPSIDVPADAKMSKEETASAVAGNTGTAFGGTVKTMMLSSQPTFPVQPSKKYD